MGKLTIKIFFILLTLFLMVCLATYVFIGLFLPFANEGQSRRRLDEKANTLIAELRMCKAYESRSLFVAFIRETGAGLNLLDENRKELDLFTFEPIDGEMIAGVEYPFRFADSNKEYILVASLNSVRSDEISTAIKVSLPWVGGIVLLLSFVSSFGFSRYATRPIIRMSCIAQNIANLDFSWYCPDLRNDEIGLLANSLNDLSDKLNAALSALRLQNSSLEDEIALEQERERRRLLFFSGVSHELKTPIAVVIGQLEGMQAGIGVYNDRDKYLARSAEILHSLDSFVKEILYVSHIDIADKKNSEPVNLSATLESLINDSEAFIESYSVNITSQIEKDVLVSGDAGLLKKAINNCLGNAVAYSPKDASVFVCLMRNDNVAELQIINTPAHIDENHLPHLFEAFYRGERSVEPGSGLGLYITRMIMEAYSIEHAIDNYKGGVRFSAKFSPSLYITTHKKHISSNKTPH